MSVRVAVTVALSRKECERAAGAIKATVVNVPVKLKVLFLAHRYGVLPYILGLYLVSPVDLIVHQGGGGTGIFDIQSYFVF